MCEAVSFALRLIAEKDRVMHYWRLTLSLSKSWAWLVAANASTASNRYFMVISTGCYLTKEIEDEDESTVV